MESGNSNQDSKTDFNGNKIFFLYPNAIMQNQVIGVLAQNEYEIYLAKDHSRLSYVLTKYSNSVVFIYLDDKVPIAEWEKWIGTALDSEPTTKIGVFSSNNDEEFREKFLKNNRIQCGFFNIKHDLKKTADVVLEMMNAMNVKGRRKYLRISPDKDTIATINIPSGGEFLKGVIKDISVVGVSCVFEQEPNLKKGALLKDIQIKLQSMLLNVEAVVFGSRDYENERTYVLLFTQRIDTETRSSKIRSYIQRNLQQRMDSEIN